MDVILCYRLAICYFRPFFGSIFSRVVKLRTIFKLGSQAWGTQMEQMFSRTHEAKVFVKAPHFGHHLFRQTNMAGLGYGSTRLEYLSKKKKRQAIKNDTNLGFLPLLIPERKEQTLFLLKA